MNFLNLSPLELMAIAGGLATAVTLLYLLDRSRRKLVVPVLKFWRPALEKAQVERRRKITQPWSLLLQILALLLLVLAIAQPRFSGVQGEPRHHVLILDTSAMTAAQYEGRTLLQRGAGQLLQALQKVPAGDRVMLIRAEGVPSTAVAFTDDHGQVERALRETQPGGTALRIIPALELATSTLRNARVRAGEVIYAGPARAIDAPQFLLDKETQPLLRVLPVEEPFLNSGLRKIALQPGELGESAWTLSATVGNDMDNSRAVSLFVSVGKALVADRKLNLVSRSEQQVEIPLQIRQSGEVRVWIEPNDALPADNEAVLELPARPVRKVAVFTEKPQVWKALIDALGGYEAQYLSPGQYTAKPAAGLAVVDDFVIPAVPQVPALLVGRAAASSGSAAEITTQRWSGSHPVARGLQAYQVHLQESRIVSGSMRDAVLLESAKGPLALASTEDARRVSLGFPLMGEELRTQVASPILFANALQWLSPDRAEAMEARVSSAGAVGIPMLADVDPNEVQVATQDGTELPFTLRDRQLQFYSGAGGMLRIRAGQLESSLSLSLPEVTLERWKVPADVKRGMPTFFDGVRAPFEIWPFLVMAALALLVLDWLLFGSRLFHKIAAAPATLFRETLRKAS